MSGDPPRFAIRNLSILAYAQGFALWHYRANKATEAPATLADILRPGFFNNAADGETLMPGDHMAVSATDGGCVLYVDSVVPDVVVHPMMSTVAKELPR
jgi:hypothetical protein